MTSNPATPGTLDKPRRGDLIDLDVTRIDERGRGLGEFGGFTIVARNANPGSRVRVRIIRKVKRERFEGIIEDVLEPSPHVSDPRCPHSGICGGCALPRLDYGEQLRQKKQLVAAALQAAFEANACGQAADDVLALLKGVVPSAALEGYRNKMDFTFGARRYILEGEPENVDASFGLGLHVPRLHQKVLDVEHCAIAFDGASQIVCDARRLAKDAGLAPWDLRDQTGLLRHLVLRRGVRTGETMVHLVTRERAPELIDPYVEALLAIPREHPITTVVQGVTDRASTVAIGDDSHVLFGPGYIEEVLCGKRFRISADSFFQTNTAQAERLFEIASDFADVGGGVLYDLYCGAGTIGLAIGEGARKIVGIEAVASAVRDARGNAQRAGAVAAEFYEGDALHLMETLKASDPPDVVVLDPPRAGLHPKVPAHVVALAAPRIVFVSCNPKTGATDVAALCAGGYRVDRIEMVDLFPHTAHVEVVFSLTRDVR